MDSEKVVTIMMVKNEVDIIGYTIDHLISQDIDMILIADNMSIDGTTDVLVNKAKQYDGKIAIIDDLEIAYYQSQKMTAMAKNAHDNYGADWILPVDADELWYSFYATETVGSILRNIPINISVICGAMWDHRATINDLPSENPYISMIYRKNERGYLNKIAYRYNEKFVIAPGNHGVWDELGSLIPVVSVELGLRHFPYRTFDQWLQRIKDGSAAYAAVENSDDQTGLHKKTFAFILKKHGEHALRRIWDYYWYYIDPDKSKVLIREPAPFCRVPKLEKMEEVKLTEDEDWPPIVNGENNGM